MDLFDAFINEYYKQVMNNPKVKGAIGETVTNFQLNFIKGYKQFLYNLYLPTNKKTTTEIDTIMIHETGIYVFETKNYSGWIFGSENDDYWIKCSHNGRKYKFYNPVKQNSAHINALINTLPIKVDRQYFHSYVVFTGNCELIKIPQGNNFTVINNLLLNPLLTKRIAQAKKIMDKPQIDYFYNELIQYTKASKNIKDEHIKNIYKNNN